MSYDCYCDGETPTVYEQTDHIARKEHKCSECSGVIEKHEPYERTFGVWPSVDGLEVFKTCIRCLALREFVQTNVKCFCWNHGNMIQDAIDEAQNSGTGQQLGSGLLFGAYRRFVLIRRHRKFSSLAGRSDG